MVEEKKEYWRWPEGFWVDPDIDWKKAKFITAGLDVGSVSSQAVVVVDGELFSYGNTRTGSDSPDSARKALALAIQSTDLEEENINYCIGTGYGRVNLPMAQKTITEIACHARGANFMYGPTVKTVLDMGGQDCKAIRCDERGKVICALDLVFRITQCAQHRSIHHYRLTLLINRHEEGRRGVYQCFTEISFPAQRFLCLFTFGDVHG